MIVALFTCPSTYLADTWSVTLREDLPYIDYGKNRAGGSFGYCAMSVIAGFFDCIVLGMNCCFSYI